MATDQPTERSVRLAKLKQYVAKYGTAYPATTNRDHRIGDVLHQFTDLTGVPLIIVGRVRYWRDHGKLTFAHVEDATGKIQIALSRDHLGTELYTDLNLYDVGDIIELTGETFVTKAGEPSILAKSIRLLTKALQPLPDKWHGLQDEELRFRHRYVDLLLRPDLRELFHTKAKFWNAIRSFLVAENFLEVETPVLENTAGGADAQPFITHHNALDIDVFLRISMGELWQKRLMVGGFEKTFEIGRQFRNEGISPEHLQDYTQMEFYWAYADYTQAMDVVERLYKHAIMEAFGKLQFTIHGHTINFDQTWEKIDYCETVFKQTDVNPLTATIQELTEACQRLQLSLPDQINQGRLIDTLWKYCRKSITGPVFLINHPVAVSPLAKRKPNQPNLVERFQVICAGSELGNGYSELNDPIDQAERFNEQANLRASGDSEAQMTDLDFVNALEVGMPPTAGFGVSERLFAFLVDKPIRECVLFPLLRPKTTEPSSVTNVPAQSDETLKAFEAGISRADALAWMHSKVTDFNLQRHMLATEALMIALGKRLGAASPEAWGIAGLLHDIDWEETEPEQHSLVGADWLLERGVHPAIVAAVREHNYTHGLPAITTMSKALASLEQLTGLITAVALVRPDKKIADVQVSSVKKKMNDKAFARGVERTMLKQCEPWLGLTLDEAMTICLTAMQAIASDLKLA